MFFEFTAEVSGSIEADSEEEARQEIRAMFHRFSFVDIVEIEMDSSDAGPVDVVESTDQGQDVVLWDSLFLFGDAIT